MKNQLLPILVLLVTLTGFSQEDVSERTKTFLSENTYLTQVDKEKFYLHTNKTTFYSGEKIWFKAYIVEDSNNKPNLNTNNLFINFYSPEKKLISSQLFYAEAGFAYGEIDLNPDLSPGTYYIDLDTNRNKNFKSGSVLAVQILSVSDTKSPESSTSVLTKNSVEVNKEANYSMQFFPESQILLKDETNNLAFTIKNNHIPVKASGKIIDNATGKTISTFMSDRYGLGRLHLDYNSNFSAVININGIDKKFPLPQANSLGFIIQKKLQPIVENTTSIQLKTNEATSSNYKNESLILVLHRNGFAKSVASIEIDKKTTSYQINFLNENLFSGINTLTLFDKNNKPISEYSFWNEPKHIELEVVEMEASTDSITLNLNMLNKLSDANLSLSVLPEATISYSNQQNIITEFQLVPYLNDPGFSLAEYYETTNGNKHSMDLLIQTFIKSNNVQIPIKTEGTLVFQPEHGVKIKGSVNSKDKDLSKHKVMLSSKENNLLLIKPLKGEKQFEFDSLMLAHPSKYKLALLDDKGEIEKANFYIFKTYNKYRPDSLLTKPTPVYTKTKLETVNEIEDEYIPVLMKEEILNEVLIKTKTESDKEILTARIYSRTRALGFTRIYTPDEERFAGADIVFYLRTLPGIAVVQDSRSVTIMNGRGPGPGALVKEENNNSGKQLGYQIYLDDFPISDHSELLYMQMFDVASVTVNSLGAGYGLQGGGGVIHIYTKTPELMKGIDIEKVNPNIQISETEFGFSLPTENFKNSQVYYPNLSSEELYSTIDWVPNFYLNANTPNYLTVSTKNHKNLKLFINGLNANGQLIYKMITINKDFN